MICRFGRRSPFRGQRFNRFNDRRSRSRSRDSNRFDRGRRNDRGRRSRSESPVRNDAYMQQPAMYTDAYGNYLPNAPAAPNFGTMQMDPNFNGYDFQGATAFAPPAPSFGISCPAPPGMTEGWIPPPPIVHEESEEDKMKREGSQHQ